MAHRDGEACRIANGRCAQGRIGIGSTVNGLGGDAGDSTGRG